MSHQNTGPSPYQQRSVSIWSSRAFAVSLLCPANFLLAFVYSAELTRCYGLASRPGEPRVPRARACALAVPGPFFRRARLQSQLWTPTASAALASVVFSPGFVFWQDELAMSISSSGRLVEIPDGVARKSLHHSRFPSHALSLPPSFCLPICMSLPVASPECWAARRLSPGYKLGASRKWYTRRASRPHCSPAKFDVVVDAHTQ